MVESGEEVGMDELTAALASKAIIGSGALRCKRVKWHQSPGSVCEGSSIEEKRDGSLGLLCFLRPNLEFELFRLLLQVLLIGHKIGMFEG